MPMIRFRYNCCSATGGMHGANYPIEVKTRSGFRQSHFAGFVCKQGISGYNALGEVKIRAMMITNGNIAGEWRELKTDQEFVKGIRYIHEGSGLEQIRAIVGKGSWPVIVVGDERTPLRPRFQIIPKGRVVNLSLIHI